MRQNNIRNTNDRDQASAQKTKKTGQKKNNHRKNKITTSIAGGLCVVSTQRRSRSP